MSESQIPNCEEFLRGIEAFERNEKRVYVYFDALGHVSSHWGDSKEMARGIEILLHGWHHVFYRFGDLDFEQLRECVERNLEAINRFKNRNILSLASEDEDEIKILGHQFLDALQGGNRKSPVAMAKALHLLAPHFFPLWDTDIAVDYGSWWVYSDFGVLEYIPFCWKMRRVAEKVKDCKCASSSTPTRSLLKLIDEYNYSKAHGWL